MPKNNSKSSVLQTVSNVGKAASEVLSDALKDTAEEEFNTTVFGDVIIDIQDIPEEIVDPV